MSTNQYVYHYMKCWLGCVHNFIFKKIVFVLKCSMSSKIYSYAMSFQDIGRIYYSIQVFLHAQILLMPEGVLRVV